MMISRTMEAGKKVNASTLRRSFRPYSADRSGHYYGKDESLLWDATVEVSPNHVLAPRQFHNKKKVTSSLRRSGWSFPLCKLNRTLQEIRIHM
ncbi:hypothetical protein NPIL_395021 [Nephila pilipes]|uniref:Uncharacterized protein n=1 Tax=Nephila pilipes TaxID=299642 RepID=A0A8X6TG19_NEPPI|nr:hypothetical protein NPIL_395021 [Nephila pilipes]